MLTGEEEVEIHDALSCQDGCRGGSGCWPFTLIVYIVSKPPIINNSTPWPYPDPAPVGVKLLVGEQTSILCALQYKEK